WKRFLPVLPILVFQQNGNWRTDRHTVSNARENAGSVTLDLHAAAAHVALLATPKITVEKRLVDFQSSRHAGEKGHQSFPVRSSGREIAQHEIWIVSDGDCKSRTAVGRHDELILFSYRRHGLSC